LDALQLYLVPDAKNLKLRPLTDLLQAVWIEYQQQATASPLGTVELSFVSLRGLALALQHSKSGESDLQPLRRVLLLCGGGSSSLTSPPAKTIAGQVARRVVKHAETYLPSIHPKPDDILRFLVRHDFVGADTHLISFLPEFESNATTVFGVRQGPSGT
jgi:hypothetical protein